MSGAVVVSGVVGVVVLLGVGGVVVVSVPVSGGVVRVNLPSLWEPDPVDPCEVGS